LWYNDTRVEKEQVMKNVMTIVVVLCIACAAQASYTYTYGAGTNFGAKTLTDSESILVNGGGGDRLNLEDYAYARIESTSLLQYGVGGIWLMPMYAYSSARITGGEFNTVYVEDYSHLTMSGGKVNYLYGELIPPIPAAPTSKYIQFICKSYSYSPGTKKLNGVWEDNSLFNIQLVDTSPYPSTYDSINFTIVPEPLSLGLLALGGLFARQMRKP
jgi:hypothetical protein